MPVFHYMVCFRALYELAISRLSRTREYRADKIAADVTSPSEFAGALLRVIAYSKYRASIEQKLFEHDEALSTVNIGEQLEQGFPAYALEFASDEAVGELCVGHPFDSHPRLSQRLEALNISFSPESSRTLLGKHEDSRWYQNIHDAESLERQQWTSYEEGFRKFHESILPYRYLPETEAEIACVIQAFPEVSFASVDGQLVIDYQQITFAKWDEPLAFEEIKSFTNNEGTLIVTFDRSKIDSRKIELKKFPAVQQARIIDCINRYYGRHLAATEYQQQKRLKNEIASKGTSP